MPSAEEILKARDEGAPVAEEKIAVDYPEEKHPSEQDKSVSVREPGRLPFAAQEPSPKRQEPPGDDPDDGDDDKGPVPYQALKAERQKAKRYTEEVTDLRRQLAELTSAVLKQREVPPPQQPQAPPEFDWDNPLGTVDQRLEARITQERAAIQSEFQRQREAMQSQFAITRHGEDVVKGAYEALQAARETDPQWMNDYQRIMRSPDQYEAMVQWHKQKTALQEVGSDLEAYKARIKAEYLEELRTGRVTDEIGAEAPRQAKPATDRLHSGSPMPSNLSSARNVGSRNGAAWSGPASIKDILGNR
jgi:hypothetical protein